MLWYFQKDNLDKWDFILFFVIRLSFFMCASLCQSKTKCYQFSWFYFERKMLLASSVHVKFGYFYVPERFNLYFTLQSFSALDFNADFFLFLLRICENSEFTREIEVKQEIGFWAELWFLHRVSGWVICCSGVSQGFKNSLLKASLVSGHFHSNENKMWAGKSGLVIHKSVLAFWKFRFYFK